MRCKSDAFARRHLRAIEQALPLALNAPENTSQNGRTTKSTASTHSAHLAGKSDDDSKPTIHEAAGRSDEDDNEDSKCHENLKIERWLSQKPCDDPWCHLSASRSLHASEGHINPTVTK